MAKVLVVISMVEVVVATIKVVAVVIMMMTEVAIGSSDGVAIIVATEISTQSLREPPSKGNYQGG